MRLTSATCGQPAAHFIRGVEEAGHTHPFGQFYQRLEAGRVEGLGEVDAGTGTTHSHMFVNGSALDGANQEVGVPFPRYTEMGTNGGAIRKWTWVVEGESAKADVRLVMRGGRARLRVGNEASDTPEGQGYHFGHDYGHGHENLGVVLALLVMAACPIDRVQQRCNELFEKARAKAGPKCASWEAVRHPSYSPGVGPMRETYEAIAFGYERPQLQALIEQTRAEVQRVGSS